MGKFPSKRIFAGGNCYYFFVRAAFSYLDISIRFRSRSCLQQIDWQAIDGNHFGNLPNLPYSHPSLRFVAEPCLNVPCDSTSGPRVEVRGVQDFRHQRETKNSLLAGPRAGAQRSDPGNVSSLFLVEKCGTSSMRGGGDLAPTALDTSPEASGNNVLRVS